MRLCLLLLSLGGCAAPLPPSPAPAPVCAPCVCACDKAAPSGCRGDAPGPFVRGDGALVLTGDSVLTLGEGPHSFARICVEDQAALRLCGDAEIILTGNEPSVVGGRGIGGSSAPASVSIDSRGGALYVLADNAAAPMKLTLRAPSATVGLTGKSGLEITRESRVGSMAYNAGYGDTHNFPACSDPKKKPRTPESELRAKCGVPDPEERAYGGAPAPPAEPAGQNVAIFTYAAAPHTFTVPAGVQQLTIEAWGGGGGGGSADKAEARGGGGAFARATFDVRPGDRLELYVAGGGGGGPLPGFGTHAGGGGGASYVVRGQTTLLVAAGGGGAAADGCGGCEHGMAGSGGGGGMPGDSASCYVLDGDCASGGRAGSPSEGGAGGVGPSGTGGAGGRLAGGESRGWTGVANGGDKHLGGTTKAGNGSGGGGGAGWYGGGGGGWRVTYCGGGGGGGSSYAHPKARASFLLPGRGAQPGNVADMHWGEAAGTGGAPGQPGRSGRVVVVY